MVIQDQIAPYLNRFVFLLNQNATAKLEIGCTDGKVTVNMSHDLGAVVKTAPINKPEKQQYSDVLRKKVRPSQLKRLQKRADARAAQAKVSNHEHDAGEAIEDTVLEAEQVNHEAENARQMAEKDQTEAENAPLDNPVIVESKASSESAHIFNTPEQMSSTLRCSLCRKPFPDMSRYENKRPLKVKCPLCDDTFLAALSSSRSLVVRLSVCRSVRRGLWRPL